ncbi:MAG: efflux RND transporter periplasmic adaptor subunit, partial [Verrucomicrobiota bacterium]
LVRRDDTMGVFVVNDEGSTVRWVQVEVLVSNEGRIAVEGEGLRGRVVTLGQQMLEDGSAIVIPDDRSEVAEEVPT